MVHATTDGDIEIAARGEPGGSATPPGETAAFAALSEPSLLRWMAAVLRQTRVACVALALTDGAQQVVRSMCGSGADPLAGLSELPPDVSLETWLRRSCAHGVAGPHGAYAAAPVIVDGQRVGTLAIADGDRVALSADEQAMLADAAAGVAADLEGRRAKVAVSRARALSASHDSVYDLIRSGVPLHDVLVDICHHIERHDPRLMASVLLRDPLSNTLHSGVGPSLPKAYIASIDGVPIGPCIGTCGPAAWFGRLTISTDLQQDPNWQPIRAMAELAGVAHCWSMPILDAAGDVMGTLALYGRAPRVPEPEHVALLQGWARVAGTAIERARSLDRLTHDARHDSLTGLPNRAAIFERLDGAIQRVRPGEALGVLFVDLDGLKALNDTLGHDVADEMIREVAKRLQANVRHRDFVGRFGGDEFIVIGEGLLDADEARALGARLLEAVAQPLPGLESRVVTASIGISLVRSNDIDAREAIRRADAAMYDAKRGGRDRCAFADGGEEAPAGRRLQLARALRGADRRGELHLVYQPIIALPDRRIVGVEALVRWTSREFGAVTPAEFIPIAEDTGSILQLGAWVLRESCEALAALAANGRSLELAVNVSARQLSHRDFPLWVRQTLGHVLLPATMLSLELTETSLLRPDGVTVDNLRALDELAVRVAVDDFGTGYSSLVWLRDHPSGTIKIDRRFVAGLQHGHADRAIVAGIVRMAKDLGCSVVAEGVETEEQLAILESLGCDRAQGYWIARPMPIEALRELCAPARTGVPA